MKKKEVGRVREGGKRAELYRIEDNMGGSGGGIGKKRMTYVIFMAQDTEWRESVFRLDKFKVTWPALCSKQSAKREDI